MLSRQMNISRVELEEVTYRYMHICMCVYQFLLRLLCSSHCVAHSSKS